MEISTQQTAEGTELAVSGRLDAYWADHLSKALDEAVRGGGHHIRLNMAEVVFVSSVGIRVLLKFYKELQRLSGSFVVVSPSNPVKTVLELAGLEVLLEGAVPTRPAAATAPVSSRLLERDTATFEVFATTRPSALRCRVIGDPALLDGCRFGTEHAAAVRFPENTFGLGLGGFGEGFEDCRGRFGEFLAVAGAAAYMPTDGTNVPDEVVSSKALVPEVNVLYALVCEGSFGRLARFEAGPGSVVTLAEITEACLAAMQTEAVGIVMIAESAGLMGAALRRSPALEAVAGAPFGYPEIRQWLSFSHERVFARSQTVVVGVAAHSEQPQLAPLLRPLGGSAAWPAGHFHAAAFSYRPLPKGWIELAPTVATLFTTETLQGVLHLLNDDRAGVGNGQSEFVRGACWVAPITETAKEGR